MILFEPSIWTLIWEKTKLRTWCLIAAQPSKSISTPRLMITFLPCMLTRIRTKIVNFKKGKKRYRWPMTWSMVCKGPGNRWWTSLGLNQSSSWVQKCKMSLTFLSRPLVDWAPKKGMLLSTRMLIALGSLLANNLWGSRVLATQLIKCIERPWNKIPIQSSNQICHIGKLLEL